MKLLSQSQEALGRKKCKVLEERVSARAPALIGGAGEILESRAIPLGGWSEKCDSSSRPSMFGSLTDVGCEQISGLEYQFQLLVTPSLRELALRFLKSKGACDICAAQTNLYQSGRLTD